MGLVQRPLRFLALLLGGQQLFAERAELALEFAFALLQAFDLLAQGDDLALAQQRALLGRALPRHPHPAFAQALAVAGDDRIALVQPRLQVARGGQVLGAMQARQQAADRQRSLHARGQRGRREIRIARGIGHQRDAAFAQFAQRIDQRFGRIHQHAFDQLAQRAFHRVFPAAFDGDALAHARGRIQPLCLQPGHRGALLLAERGLLQGFQRGQAAARGLRLLAHLGQFGLAGTLPLLQRRRAFLAQFHLFVQFVQRCGLGFVLQLQLLERLGQRLHVEAGALGGQRLAAAVGFQDLAVEIVDAGALHLARAGGFGGVAVVRFPALLPVVQRGFGLAQSFLAELVLFLQLFQLRLGVLHRLAQHHQPRLVAADVLAQFGQGLAGLVARLVQALRHLALVLDLLFQPRQRAADLVDVGLRAGQRLGRFLATHAAGLDAALGLALLGDELLQPGFLARQRLAQAAQARIQAAVFQRLPLRVLDPAFFLQGLVLLGLPRLAAQVLELLADLLAQVAQALQVLAGMADAGLGLLAALLVLGDAGGLFQVDAQVFRARLDDLADHALLDDRVAARAQAGAEEQVGDVAAPALGAVEVVVAAAVAADQALDRDFVERGVLAGDGVVGVVEDQLDRGLRDRLAPGRAGEDHVGQRIAAQAAGRALAHHPAHRIDDVGLAAAVGPDHAGHVGRQVQRRGIDEGLETGQFDRG